MPTDNVLCKAFAKALNGVDTGMVRDAVYEWTAQYYGRPLTTAECHQYLQLMMDKGWVGKLTDPLGIERFYLTPSGKVFALS